MNVTTLNGTIPDLTDTNTAAVQALWEAYVTHWVDHVRDGHATWADLVTVFKQTERQEEVLAAALLMLAETSPKRREYNRGYVNGFRAGQADERTGNVRR